MAEKRHLEAAGAVVYSKLPRLEGAPSHVHTAGVYRSGVLPGRAPDSHYSYQGTYYGYPMQCHESPELSVNWNSTESYVPCMDRALSQQLGMEKAHCMLSRQESEGLGTWAQNPSYEKRKDCLVGDALAAQEKWANYSNYTDYLPQGWVPGFSMLHASRVPTGCLSLVAPKPVYQNHIYCTEAGCSPKGSLASGTPVESPLKRPTNVEWTLPSSGHLVDASSGAAKKAPVSESDFLPLHQSWKDPVAAPSSFSPYHKTFENLRVAPSPSLANASYPATCKKRKSVPEECSRSPCGKVWPKLPPPASPMAPPQGLIYQERSSACYPLPSYPLTPHEQLVLYQRNIAQAEKQKALFALPACKHFNYPAGEDPQFLSRAGYSPAPRSYYPGHLDSYCCRPLGSPLVTSPGLKASRDHESQQHSQSKISFEQRTPVSTCSVTEKAFPGSSVPDQEGVQDWPGAKGTMEPANERFQCQQVTLQPRAFQSLPSVERLPSCVDGYGRPQEAFYGAGPCPPEKGPLHAEKQSDLSFEDEKRDVGKTLPSGACIVIPDSPVTSHDSCLKGDSLRSRILESSDSTFQHVPQSPDKEPRDLRTKGLETPAPPSSPPMPVIHNVFSLAPYQEYLEGSAVSLCLPSSKGCLAEKPSSEKSGPKAEGMTSRPPSAGSSKMPGVSLDRGKDMAREAVAKGGRKDPSGSCIVTERKSGGHAGFWENYRGCWNAPATNWQGAMGRASGFAKDGHALDLSLKTEGLPGVLHAQRPAGKTEALERDDVKRHGESVTEGPANGQEAVQDPNSPALRPPPKNSSEEKSHFQSSTAFLYKKFKIQKSLALSDDFSRQRDSEPAATQQNRPPAQQSCLREATQQNCLPVPPSCQQAVTQQNSLPVLQSFPQTVTRQNSSPAQPSGPQVVAQQNSLPVPQSFPQTVTQQNSSPAQPSGPQTVARQNSLPVQQSFPQMVTRRNSLPALHIAHEKSAKPNTRLSRKCLKQPDASKLLPPAAPAGSPALGEVGASLPPGCKSPTWQASAKQYFTALHTSICAVISDSVSTSSPEELGEWLEKVEPEREPRPKAKAKSGPKTPEAPRPSQGKRVWLAFKGAAKLFNQLQSQLETFVFIHDCPFPHVVRAGAIFVPIHMVKERLFGHLPGPSVDHVLQAHKVELRPTTLSEERLLRELDLKTCTSRLLKLLALKQLPDIYPDLLDLHWHHCVKEQLGEPAKDIQNGDLDAAGLEAVDVSRCLQRATLTLHPGIRGSHKQSQKCESAPKTRHPIDPPKSQGRSSSLGKRKAAATPTKRLPQEDAGSVAEKTKHCPLRSGAKRRLFHACQLTRTLRLQLADRVARSATKVLRLRKPIVRIKFRNALRERPVLAGKKQKRPASLHPRRFRPQRTGARHAPRRRGYPELVGKRIRHLYEEKDKSEAWYQGVVLRVHQPHRDPLKTVYEVKYDSEPEWQYYLEILQDYKKGWLEVDD